MAIDNDRAIDSDLLSRLKAEFSARLCSEGIDVDGSLAADKYISFFDSRFSLNGYSYVPPIAKEWCDAIDSLGGQEAIDIYHRLVLVKLIEGFDRRAAAVSLPDWLRAPTRTFILDVLEALTKSSGRKRLLNQDSFMKDFAVCRLKLWPCGAELVDVASMLSRSLLISGGPSQAVKAIFHIGGSIRGFKPVFETHFDTRRAKAFSYEGYHDLYKTIARLMREKPSVKGVYACSWWHDPAVAEISPNLAFLNDLPLGGGAKAYRFSRSEQIIKAATRLSRERTERFQQGSYHPTSYIVLWGRRELLSWAEKQP